MNKQNKQLDQPESRRLSSTSTQSVDPTSINMPPAQQPADQQLNGIAGWLAFFMVVLTLGGLLFTGIFFDELVKIRYTPHTPLQFYLYFDLPAHSFLSCLTDILPAQISGSVITSPVVATLAITAVIAISQRKKLGKRLAIAAYISCLVNHFPMVDNVRYDVEEMPTVIINAIISVVIPATIIGLLCLYFCVSKRVKETLTERDSMLSAQPQATPIQYAVTTPPLKGITGWLAFFMVILGLSALISITILFTSLLRIDLPYAMVSIVMTPIVTILAINTAMAINARKKLGKRLAIDTLVTSFVHTVIVTIISMLTDDVKTETLTGFFFIITLQAIAIGLCYMYFRTSRRVKETLQEKQPTDQQHPTKSQVAPVQPTATSSLHLNGIAGWLAFFMVVLALGGLLFAGTFFDTLAHLAKYKSPGYSDPTSGSIFPFPFTIIKCILSVDPNESSYIVSAIIAPIVTALAIAAIVAISMRRKSGKRLAIAAYVSCFIHQVLCVVFSIMGTEYFESEREALIINTIGLFTIQAIVIGLFCLYFCTSRRVKETLIK